MNQKLENILNVSLDATEDELRKADSLSTGYNWRDNTWEIIVKYSGSLESIRNRYNVYIKELLNYYAIIVADKATIELISQEDVIDYVEKPKSLYYQIERTKTAACVGNVRAGGGILSGKGVIVGVIDTGIDIFDNAFRNSDGTTRILNIYDQTTGEKYDKQSIDEYIKLNEDLSGGTFSYDNAPGVDNIMHGTDVSYIAAGSLGVAYEADIIAVKMGYSINNQFPRTTSLMDAIDYIIRKAIEYRKPVAVNISYGCNYGAHNGNTLLESFIDDISKSYRCVICVGSGNEADKAIHFGGIINTGQVQTAYLSVGEYQSAMDIQIWKNYWDTIDVMLINPRGEQIGIITEGKINRYETYNTEIITLLGEPSPYNIYQEIYINLIPKTDYILSGIWQIVLMAGSIRAGEYNIWLPSSQALGYATAFNNPTADGTITIPATARNCIAVGAYNAYTNSYATFSGRGFDNSIRNVNVGVKPDITAPGVDISIARQRGNDITYRNVTGTSYAVPVVTGAAALLMQWGIVMGNDRFMYGEKLKAALINGSKPVGLVGITRNDNHPDPRTGWGAVCLKNTLNKIL